MQAINSILVPVDFSAHSNLALAHAVDLARRYGAALEIVHVYQSVAVAMPEGYVLVSPDQLADILTRFQLQLESAKKDALAQGISNVQTALLQGDAVHEILQRVQDSKHDLIVMGTNGRKGMKRLLLGSVAENIVRLATCPVLTVRAPD